MKTIKWVIWILIAIAIALIIIAILSFVLGVDTWGINLISFFHTANTFLLLAIVLYMVTGGLKGWFKEI